jgi:hypothetical protein
MMVASKHCPDALREIEAEVNHQTRR